MELEDKADLVEPQSAQIRPEPAIIINKVTVEFESPFGWIENAADHVQERRLT